MPRTSILFILLLATLASAWSDSTAPTTFALSDAVGISAARMGTNPPGQVQHVEALASAVEAAWVAKDATAYAASYAEDVAFIGPIANIISGREALRAQHAFLFGPGPFSQSTLDIEVLWIQFLTGTIAVVDLNFTLTGFIGLPPGLRATEPGVQRSVARWVVVKDRGEWQILAQQMTPVPPMS